jgi:hypothetical protein
MNQKHLQILLSIVAQNGNVNTLLEQNLSYANIAALTEQAIKSGLIVYDDDKITLSEIGLTTLQQLREQSKRTDKDQWIGRKKGARIEGIDSNFIYLPSQNELFF